jgi:hypothetical protein
MVFRTRRSAKETLRTDEWHAIIRGASTAIRRRRALCVFACLSLGFLTHSPARTVSLRRDAFCFATYSSSLSERLSRRVYCMSRYVYDKLVDILGENDPYSNRDLLATKLSMTLRWLAGGSYLDISLCHRVGIATFFKYTQDVLFLIQRSLTIIFDVKNIDYLEEQSHLVARGSSPLTGCVGALDGLAVRITEPSSAEVANPSTYYNRKRFRRNRPAGDV